MGGAPRTVVWRGQRFDPETAVMLAQIAKVVGDDIYVRPIQGSYSTGTAASAGTHAGGGAFDLDCEPLSDAQARRLESACRQFGAAAWFRPRVSPSGIKYGWQRHVHGLRLDCTDLSVAARVQTVAYFGNRSGLADNRTDTGTRAYVGHRWASVKATLGKPAITPGTPGKIPPIGGPITPPPLEDDLMSMTPAARKAFIDDIAKACARAVHDQPLGGATIAPGKPLTVAIALDRTYKGVSRLDAAALEAAMVAALRKVLPPAPEA